MKRKKRQINNHWMPYRLLLEQTLKTRTGTQYFLKLHVGSLSTLLPTNKTTITAAIVPSIKYKLSVFVSCKLYRLITLPLFFKPFVPCITMWILELVPAPRMFPVAIWTLYTIPGGYSYMSGYRRLCQQVTMVQCSHTPWRAEQELVQPDLNINSLNQELMITQRASGKLDWKHRWLN